MGSLAKASPISALGLVITAFLVCVACTAPEPPSTPSGSPSPAAAPSATAAPRFSLLGRVRDLVLPLSALPAGSFLDAEGDLTLEDIARTAWPSDAERLKIAGTVAELHANGAVSGAHLRSRTPNGGPLPRTVELIVVLFRDEAGARRTIDELGRSYNTWNWRDVSLGTTIGDRSRAVGGVATVQVEERSAGLSEYVCWSAYRNALVQVEVDDDVGAVGAEDCAQLARVQLAHLTALRP